jgi:hypothetical protein
MTDGSLRLDSDNSFNPQYFRVKGWFNATLTELPGTREVRPELPAKPLLKKSMAAISSDETVILVDNDYVAKAGERVVVVYVEEAGDQECF